MKLQSLYLAVPIVQETGAEPAQNRHWLFKIVGEKDDATPIF
jgi:hypothetical protein